MQLFIMTGEDEKYRYVLTQNVGEWEGDWFHNLHWTAEENLEKKRYSDVVVLTQKDKEAVEKLISDTSAVVDVKSNGNKEWLEVLTAKQKFNFVEIKISLK